VQVWHSEAGEAADVARWLAGAGIAVDGLAAQAATPDLGERMRAAMAAALASSASAAAAAGAQHGGGSVLIVGTDVPDLSTAELEAARGALRAGADVVLGPAADGGYYLLGLRGPAVHPALFAGIAWSTAGVLEQTLAAAAAAGLSVAPLATLPTLRDIDTRDDLLAWLAGRAGGAGGAEEPRTAAVVAAARAALGDHGRGG